MPKTPKYEQQHYANINSIERQIQKLYSDADFELSYFVRATFHGAGNYIKSPLFLNKLDDIESKLHDSIVNLIGQGVVKSDTLSDTKSKATIADITKGRKELQIAFAKEYTTTSGNASAYFSQRRKQGFDISARVWDVAGQKRAEIADSVSAAIDSGVSADSLAKEVQKYLRDPDKVFRRVRNAKGELVESQARKNYHPGQGVYKSSQANAFRMSRTEINIAYRNADLQRWQQQDFVKGYRVKLSNNSKHCDFCVQMQGDYPKTFKWGGWHPQCRCSCTPILLTEEERDKYEDHLLGLDDMPLIGYVEALPASATEYIRANADRIKGWKNTPYWVSDNENYVSGLLTKK